MPKLSQNSQISFFVYQVAQAVAGTGDRYKSGHARVCFVAAAAHVAGNESIVAAMNEDDGDLCIGHSIDGGILLQIKTTEHLGAQLYKRVSQLGWQLHIHFDDLFDDFFGGLIKKEAQNSVLPF